MINYIPEIVSPHNDKSDLSANYNYSWQLWIIFQTILNFLISMATTYLNDTEYFKSHIKIKVTVIEIN